MGSSGGLRKPLRETDTMVDGRQGKTDGHLACVMIRAANPRWRFSRTQILMCLMITYFLRTRLAKEGLYLFGIERKSSKATAAGGVLILNAQISSPSPKLFGDPREIPRRGGGFATLNLE